MSEATDDAVYAAEEAAKKAAMAASMPPKEVLEKEITEVTGVPTETVPETKPNVMHISRRWEESGSLKKEETEEEFIEVRTYPAGVPMAQVGYNCNMTLNLTNYEFVKIGVEVSLPSAVEELPAAYAAAKMFVDHRLNKEVAQIREYRAKKRGEKEI